MEVAEKIEVGKEENAREQNGRVKARMSRNSTVSTIGVIPRDFKTSSLTNSHRHASVVPAFNHSTYSGLVSEGSSGWKEESLFLVGGPDGNIASSKVQILNV